jgi:CRP-like cAMP-binding protein
MLSFLDNFRQDVSISDDLRQLVEAGLVVKTIPKGTLLLRAGEVSNRVYFVKQGCLRSYAIDAKGKEHIYMFAPEGWLIGDTASNVHQNPADLFIDALEDSIVEVFDKTFIDKYESLSPDLDLMDKERLRRRIAVLQKRIIMLMSASAWERYQDFIHTYPNIVQRVPQRMVASYLGITPEALSKIRGDSRKTR